MSVYLQDGMVLLNGGSVATDSGCCCDTGACCFDDGSCELVSESQCLDDGGNFQGNGTTCVPNPCCDVTASITTHITGTFCHFNGISTCSTTVDTTNTNTKCCSSTDCCIPSGGISNGDGTYNLDVSCTFITSCGGAGITPHHYINLLCNSDQHFFDTCEQSASVGNCGFDPSSTCPDNCVTYFLMTVETIITFS